MLYYGAQNIPQDWGKFLSPVLALCMSLKTEKIASSFRNNGLSLYFQTHLINYTMNYRFNIFGPVIENILKLHRLQSVRKWICPRDVMQDWKHNALPLIRYTHRCLCARLAGTCWPYIPSGCEWAAHLPILCQYIRVQTFIRACVLVCVCAASVWSVFLLL